MIAIGSHAEGCTLAVRAQPGARKNAVVGEHAGALKVAVTAPPEDGKANTALLELLRVWLGVRRSELELIVGATSRGKTFLVRGITAEELAERVRSKLG